MSLRIIEWSDFLQDSDSKTSDLQPEKSAMTIGVFDGVHLGHRKLIEKIVSRGPNPTVVTFRENPKKVISRLSGKIAAYEGDIFSLKQKLAAFERLGVKRVVLIDFSENFSKLNGKEFIDLLENHGKMGFLVIGSNFRCGYRQDANADFIREMNDRKGIPTEVVPPVTAGAEPVSSSRIRSAIIRGDLALAAALMGRSIELDLSDLKPMDPAPAEAVSADVKSGGLAYALGYDLRSVQRIAPAAGRYSVLLHPEAANGRADAEKGKIFLSRIGDSRIEDSELRTKGPPESLEFLNV